MKTVYYKGAVTPSGESLVANPAAY